MLSVLTMDKFIIRKRKGKIQKDQELVTHSDQSFH
jgi:hypothetical protein